MIEVNLLPPELRQRQRTRQLTIAVAAAVGVVVFLLLLVFFFASAKLSSAQSALEEQDATNAKLEAQIAELQRYGELKRSVVEREALVRGLLRDEVLWSGVLHDVSMVIPTEVFLNSLNGTLSTNPSSNETLVSPAGLIGSITFDGGALTQTDVAAWLDRLAEVTGWKNAWITTSTEAEGGTGVTYAGSVDLSTEAATNGPSDVSGATP